MISVEVACRTCLQTRRPCKSEMGLEWLWEVGDGLAAAQTAHLECVLGERQWEGRI